MYRGFGLNCGYCPVVMVVLYLSPSISITYWRLLLLGWTI